MDVFLVTETVGTILLTVLPEIIWLGTAALLELAIFSNVPKSANFPTIAATSGEKVIEPPPTALPTSLVRNDYN